ncbi:Arc/MetJ family transcription regulator [Streptomyces sp. V1I6]|nr:Arc/MetJ family transcription regulator [Streptomyces sp. V1I6]
MTECTQTAPPVANRLRAGATVPPMAKVTITLDAELVVEVMVLAGVGSPQDAVELVVRDYIERGHRTEARVAARDEPQGKRDVRPPDPQA